MHITEQAHDIHVIGIELRTNNGEAMHTIPPLWQRFAQEGVAASVPGKLGDEVYAVYTNFENAGRNNEGQYSLIIGAAVAPGTPAPQRMAAALIPASKRAVFPVDGGRFDQVGPTWHTIWGATDLRKTFIAEYERYSASGAIDIFIGLAE
jgi:predicted transcriptional regulator YdeE